MSHARHDELSVRLQLRFSDLNAAGHVANTAVAVLLDEARVRTLGYPLAGGTRTGDGLIPPGMSVLVGQQTVEFVRELHFRAQDVELRSWVSGLGRTRFALSSVLLDDPRDDRDQHDQRDDRDQHEHDQHDQHDQRDEHDSEGGGEVVAVADCTIVVVDASGRPTPLPPSLRQRLVALAGPPVALRPRLVLEGSA